MTSSPLDRPDDERSSKPQLSMTKSLNFQIKAYKKSLQKKWGG